MLGAIIGDVAGSSYEVDEVRNLKNKKIDYENRIKILDKNTPLFTDKSSCTDDTILTAAIAKAILDNVDYGTYLKKYAKKEVNLGLDKYGRNRFGKKFIEWVNGDYIGESYGNGCAMRISPIANYFDDLNKIKNETDKATYPSHNNEESYIASKAVSICIYLAKCKLSKQTIKEHIEYIFGYDLNFNLEDLQKNYKFTSRAKDSVPQAIYCFLVSNDFEDAIRKAISIGGDSDTIAAITGSIAEVYYGIDKKLIKEVEEYLPEYIINISNEFYKAMGKEEPFKNKLKDFFKEQNLYSEEFFDYIKTRVKTLPYNTPLGWFGCFHNVENGILKDIRILVPEIVYEENNCNMIEIPIKNNKVLISITDNNLCTL